MTCGRVTRFAVYRRYGVGKGVLNQTESSVSFFWRLRRVGAVLTAAAVLLVAGCGTDPEQDDAAPPTTAPAPPTTPPATETPDQEEGEQEEEGEPTVVNLTMIDNQLLLEETTFAAGTYTFVAEQTGSNPHALSITGPGVSETTPQVSPGGGAVELTVTLEPGTYELWCPVPGHRQDGMEVTIEVT